MAFRDEKKRYRLFFLSGLLLLGVLILVTSMVGVADISALEALKILLDRVPLLGRLVSPEGLEEKYMVIVWKLRLPRIVLAALVGMGLSVSGAAFQSMFKNPMADPYVLGVSSGAALGATLSLMLGIGAGFLGLGATTLTAFIGAITTILVVYSIAKVGNRVPIVSLILAGIAMSYLMSSVISLMMLFNRAQIEKVVFWLMGSVSAASWKQVALIAPFSIGGSAFISLFSRDLNIMLMGDESARSLGVEVETVKKVLLAVTSLIVAASVSVSGIIGFVGLIVPHTVRILIGPDNRRLIPFSALAGAMFMVLSDTIARTAIPPTEIPVGVITSVFGAPYFIYLLIKSKRKAG